MVTSEISSTQLEEWHNIASGRIFILGTGPSLLEQQVALKQLRTEATFGCNSLLKWDALPFTPTYYGVTDLHKTSAFNGLGWERLPDMPKFNVQWESRKDVHNENFIWVEKTDNSQIQSAGMVGFGKSLPPLPTGRTSPFTLAQIAVWMGYRELYFLGIEQTRGYVYDPDAMLSMTGTQAFPLDKNQRYQIAIQHSAERMRKDIEAQGGAIYDCSIGGLLNETGKHVQRRGIRRRNILEYRDIREVLA